MATPRFQYTLRELFLATTLIAFGVGGWMFVIQNDKLFDGGVMILVLAMCGGIVGAGVFTPFRLNVVGAVTGFFGVVVFIFWWILNYFHT